MTRTTRPATNLKPGETAPASGQYVEVQANGKRGHEVTVVRGEPMPPTTTAGSTYTLDDRTKNLSGGVRPKVKEHKAKE